MPVNFEFHIETVDGDHIVHLSGELDVANGDRLRDALIGVAGSAVIVDLSGLTFVDSSGISALMGARQTITAGGNDLLLRGATGNVRRVLDLCGLSFLLVE